MADHEFGFETKALHAGQIPDAQTGARAAPIYQTTSFVFDSADHAASLFNLQTFGNVYSRLSNPTTAVFEERMAALEGGRAAVATATGQAATMVALLNICQAGDHIVASSKLYGGSISMFGVNFPKLGIEATFVDPDNPENFRRALRPNTKAIFSETLGNPAINVVDIGAIGAIAREAGVPFVVDNTAASPYLCQPFRHGADVVVHSATKYIGGHGTSIGGVIVDGGTFDFGASGKHPMFTDPDPSYHGLAYWPALGAGSYALKARVQLLRDIGAAITPFNSFLFLQGLETLSLRMERHNDNARKVADYLAAHPQVERVQFAGLASSPWNERVERYAAGRGAGSVPAFIIAGGADAGRKFVEALELHSHVANIGDVRSLAIHPATTTHSQLTEAEQLTTGVEPGLVRLSVGLETIDDIIADLELGFAAAKA